MIRLILLLFAAATLSVPQRSETPAAGRVTLKYLGTAGWEISDGRTTLLVDPYLTRLHMTSPNVADHRTLLNCRTPTTLSPTGSTNRYS